MMCVCGSRVRTARIRFAPCKSPLGSPALTNSFMRASLPHKRRRHAPRAVDRLTLRRHRRRGRCLGNTSVTVPFSFAARQSRRFGDATVAERSEYLQHFAPRRERAAVLPLVAVHRLHELGLVVVVIPFTRRRVDQPPALAVLALLGGVLRAPAIGCNRDIPLPAVVREAGPSGYGVRRRRGRRGVGVSHRAVPLSRLGGGLGARPPRSTLAVACEPSGRTGTDKSTRRMECVNQN